MEGKDKKSTQCATDGFTKQFSEFLAAKNYPKLEDLVVTKLNDILYDFFSSVQTQKEEQYVIQTLKCITAGLNRYFRKSLRVDIAKDAQFVKANEMLKTIQVESEKKGKGIKYSYPPISQIDLERISEYFAVDHITVPNPKHLQQTIVFYIIYFFCQQGCDGTEYFVQQIDEMDKNHRIEETEQNNERTMYATNGKN